MVRRSPATASMADTRPLITAGPMLRASRPPKVSESTLTSWAEARPVRARAAAAQRFPADRRFMNVLLLGDGRGGFFLGRHDESGGVELWVDLDLGDGDDLTSGRALLPAVHGMREDQAVHILVIAEDGV